MTYNARVTRALKTSTPHADRSRLEPIERDTLWDRAYAALRSALLAGRYRPGDRIVLRQVADELGISLTPVRDAVNRLIAERVLERGGVGQGGGAVVPMLSPDQFDQLMTVRASLEPTAVEVAARQATPQRLAPVAEALDAMKQAITAGDTDRYLQAHHQFHFGIYGLCDMPILQDIVESVWLRCGPTLNLALPQFKPGLKRLGHHEATLAALREAQGSAAAAQVRADIESARADIRAILQLHPTSPR